MAQPQVRHQGIVRFVEVKFFFHDTIAGAEETLALGSMYSLPDRELSERTHGALIVMDLQGGGLLGCYQSTFHSFVCCYHAV
jgi:hypothetical protein